MDKISAALIFGIIVFLCIGGFAGYNAWIASAEKPQTVEAVMEQEDDEDLVFHGDTSITNHTDKKLWIRVKVLYDSRYEEEDYEILSAAVEEGYWKYQDDGWYYFSGPLQDGQSTQPLIDRLLYGGKDATQGKTGRFRLQVEAFDEAWFSEDL